MRASLPSWRENCGKFRLFQLHDTGGRRMRVIVTGGAGYIGSFAVERLIEAGHEVTVLDSLWRGHRGGVSEAAELITVDITDAKATKEAVAKVRPDAILHYAAAAIVPESVADPG